ncbi:MAG TPA: GYDIA family GHMP kinase, partial [Saprospiraceae bacterium]|nr:GYDIA family GHMP kinase [Saprospiraceae bacterium]
LTGEYFVLDGASALALPVRYGQSLEAVPSEAPGLLRWQSREQDGEIWFSAAFDLPSLRVQHASEGVVAHTLSTLLQACRRQRPDFLARPDGWQLSTQTDFPRPWGLGTSSTLIASLARWAGCDPYALLFETLGGSGYDIACAFAEGPLLYRLHAGQPQVQALHFAPSYAHSLYFVHLGKKQDSRAGIHRYRTRQAGNPTRLAHVSQLTERCAAADTLAALEQVLLEHEQLVAEALDLEPVKQALFHDYWGTVKSLGAWGGDFVLATSERGEAATRAYFREKGCGTVLPWNAMMG